jgi:endonuclease/exonuclease/phosphatase family metal-dependent hydrolase
MTVVLFWNTKKNAVQEDIGSICRDHSVDILVLAETEISKPLLLRNLNAGGQRGYHEFTRQSERIRFFSRIPPEYVTVVYEGAGASIADVNPPIGRRLLIVGAHLRSKMWAETPDHRLQVETLVGKIAELETRFNHKNTIVIGDLNMNPFEEPMVAANGFHAVMSKQVAQKLSRKVQGRQWDYFYNPMWSLMGDESRGPPGTFFRRESGTVGYFWHMFDQVLIRPALLDSYAFENMHVLTTTGMRNIYDGEIIDARISDHLPLVVRLSTGGP